MSKLSKLMEALKAIGRGVSFGGKKALSFVEWLEGTLLGSGGGGAPAYTATSSRADMANLLQETRAAVSAVQTIDPSGLALTKRFCTGTQSERESMDLSVLPSEARVLLLTMDDNELTALGQGGPGQIRKFLVGKQHAIYGVPVVGVHKPPQRVPAKRQSVVERMAWQQEALDMRPAAFGAR